jgi:hypothetical protein
MLLILVIDNIVAPLVEHNHKRMSLILISLLKKL